MHDEVERGSPELLEDRPELAAGTEPPKGREPGPSRTRVTVAQLRRDFRAFRHWIVDGPLEAIAAPAEFAFLLVSFPLIWLPWLSGFQEAIADWFTAKRLANADERSLARTRARRSSFASLAVAAIAIAAALADAPTVLALAGCSVSAATGVGPARWLRSRRHDARAFARHAERYFDADEHLIILCRDLTWGSRPLWLSQARDVLDELPESVSRVAFDLSANEVSFELRTRVRAEAPLLVFFGRSERDVFGRCATLVERIERASRNPFRTYVLVVGEGRLQPTEGYAWLQRTPIDVRLHIISTDELSGRLPSIVDETLTLRRVQMRYAARAREVGMCADRLHPVCGELLVAGLTATSTIAGVHHLLDLWESYVRLLHCVYLAIDERLAATVEAEPDRLASVALMLRGFADEAPSAPSRSLQRWLSTSDSFLSRSALPSIAGEMFDASSASATDDSRPLRLLDTFRLIRNAARHGALAHAATERLREPLITDFLLLEATRHRHMESDFMTDEAGTVRIRPADEEPFEVRLSPVIRRQGRGWEYLSGHRGKAPKYMPFPNADATVVAK